ncbi:MAG: AraC family transcriptional regulator [Lactobacillales bacterium]|jgi:AraC-like DNA-binding protein|nr:AraC family transcriptional regulator [Lactobacillales bacterium]
MLKKDIITENKIYDAKAQDIWDNIFLLKKASWKATSQADPLIFFLIKGNLRITVDNRLYIIEQDEMFLLPDKTSCKIEALKQSFVMYCSLSLESALLGKHLQETLSVENIDRTKKIEKLPISRTILQFLFLLYKYKEEGIVSYYFFNLKRDELKLLLLSYYEKKELAQFFHTFLSTDLHFRQLVLNNYFSVKNVRELAIITNYSLSGFIKKFQKVFNEPPYKWLQKQKAEKILIDINNGVKPLQEIANDYKFSSYQHFSSFCKTMFGAPPSDIYFDTNG